jgi:GTP cyclohydrolase I
VSDRPNRTTQRGRELEDAMAKAYKLILHATLGGETYEGVEKTPARAAKAILEMTSGYQIDVPTLFTTFEDEGYDEMIIERNIPFVSLCEHHLLPFEGRAHIGYLPNGRIVGLSKLARVVDAYARRLQVQERMTVQIADALDAGLDPVGSIVITVAEHSCMSCRGVRKSGVDAVMSSVRGVLREKPEARAEALALIGTV